MMRQISLANALDAIQSKTKSIRSEGLTDLEHILKQNRNKAKLQGLEDEDYKSLLESLFSTVREEKNQLIKASQSKKPQSAKAQAATVSRLATCSHAIRITVEISLQHLRHSTTLRSIFEHIFQEARDSDGEFFELLLDDYIKALQAILNHRSHLEHLTDTVWDELVDFSCKCLEHVNDISAPTQNVSLVVSRGAEGRSSHSSRSGTPALTADISGSRSQGDQSMKLSPSQRRADDLALCLAHLASVRHISILRKANEIVLAVDNILRSTIGVNRPVVQEACLKCLNALLAEAITENVAVALRTLSTAIFFIRRRWGSHSISQSLKDQMLISLLCGQPLFPKLIKCSLDEDGSSEMNGLLDRMMNEYQKKMVKDMMTLDDIVLGTSEDESQGTPFAMKSCILLDSSAKSESCWAQLNIVADLFCQLRMLPARDADLAEDVSIPAKRRKQDQPLISILRLISTTTHEPQMGSLQMLAFVVGTIQLNVQDLQSALEHLFPLISRSSGDISNWSMLALALLAQQESVKTAVSNDYTWLQVFQVAITKLSSTSVSRLACQLTNTIMKASLVTFSEIADTLDGLIAAIEVRGPSCLSDSAVSFWKTVLSLFSTHRAASYENVSKTILRWLFTTGWRPSLSATRSLAPANKQLVSARHLTDLFEALSGSENIAVNRSARRIHSPLSLARLRCLQNQDLISYLVSEAKEVPGSPRNKAKPSVAPFEAHISAQAKKAISSTTADYILSEIEYILTKQNSNLEMSQPSVTDTWNSLILSVIGLGLSETLNDCDETRSQYLRDRAGRLRDITASTFLMPDIGSDRLVSMLSTLFDFFRDMPLLPIEFIRHRSVLENGSLQMAGAFGLDFWNAIKMKELTEDNELDPMSLDESQDSCASQSIVQQPVKDIAKDWLAACTDVRAYKNTLRAGLCLAAEMVRSNMYNSDDVKSVPQTIVDFLTSLDPLDFLSSRIFLDGLYESQLHINNQHGTRLLEFLGAEIFESYELERSEMAMGVCLDLMGHLVVQWAVDSTVNDISDAANQLYAYFLKAFRRRVITPHVQICLTQVLRKVLKQSADYGKHEGLPSPRTSLFQILESGNVKVKFEIARDLHDVFGLFILREHDAILDDVEKSIPHDPHSIEVTAVRLFLLSRLACSWSTLIRRCLYAIVDGTNLMPTVTPFAQACLRFLGRQLGIHDLHKLFRLFVPQILYTWLENHDLISLPFSIFGYSSLSKLVEDTREEVVAQVVMRGKDAEADDISSMTGSLFGSLIKEAFGKCAAYCIARDTAIAPEVDPKAANAAVRLRRYVGKEQYATLISERFPEIVATFFRIVDREDQITKGFQKHQRYANAQEAFEQMISSGTAQNTPPVSQQPSFKSNCLVDELDYICARTPYDYEHLWTPSLYIYVFRTLLETVHLALGPLHAAAVVRRIRILVSMAGNVALHGYPLEMALNSLRPYLSNTHSAEDVIGLYRYLLNASKSYLISQVSFLGGFVVSVLASLRAFIDRPQESTTQESAFHATLNSAQQFHRWLINYSLSLHRTTDFSDHEEVFRNMVVAASKIGGHGSSSCQTAEGELLALLLHDQASSCQLVDDSSRAEILGLLCKNFQQPDDLQEDILADGQLATLQASAAWSLHGMKYVDPSFDLWILRVLGRSYAANGYIEPSFLRETPAWGRTLEPPADPQHPSAKSMSAVLGLLHNSARSQTNSEAGVAERTLQSLITRADADGELKCIASCLPLQTVSAMLWNEYYPPELAASSQQLPNLQEALLSRSTVDPSIWTIDVCLALIGSAKSNSFLLDLRLAVATVDDLADNIIPYILHLVLLNESGKQEQTKKIVSSLLKQMMLDHSPAMEPRLKCMLNAINYLRTQPMPLENTKSDRAQWLNVDYRLAAETALRCRMFKTALLFIEIAIPIESKSKGSRRSGGAQVDVPCDLLLEIFRNIDEKDNYYGVKQPSSLFSMMQRLDFEQAGFRSLSFRGAVFDNEIRRDGLGHTSASTLIGILNNLELSGISQALAEGLTLSLESSNPAIFDTARKLEKWDISSPSTEAVTEVILFKAFQNVQAISDRASLIFNINERLSCMFPSQRNTLSTARAEYWASLASLVELEEVLSSSTQHSIQDAWSILETRQGWMEAANYEQIDRILSSRETLFSALAKNNNLQQLTKSSPKEARLVQVKSLLMSSTISRKHGNLQKSLAAAIAIEHLLPSCQEQGLEVEAAARLEASNVLWDQGEMGPSIQILQDVVNSLDLRHQEIPVSRPELLAKLASRVSEARLEQPDQVLVHYLQPAIKELHGESSSDVAGRVFHEFASFCDQQLQNPDTAADFARAQRLRDRKAEEIRELDQMIKAAQSGSKERENLKAYRTKAKQWYDLDNDEFKRLQSSRDAILRQSLENYLLGLKASDAFDRDAMRFSALWLQHYDDVAANNAVKNHLSEVDSSKLATLMNQWTSRLLDEESMFQALLSDLVFRICVDHPFHGMYNIFASSKSKGGKDQAALSRHAAANTIVNKIKDDRKHGPRWISVHNACVNYVRFATERPEEGKWKQGAKVPLRKSSAGLKLESDVVGLKVPPATMHIPLRKDRNYKDVPVIVKWSNEFAIASGISAPKILTATASDGRKYKQLFKGGNDDLRQDAIMEQVFEQVSNLLQSQRETRQRRLGIRSYKVLPLTSVSGIIEFVLDTIPLHEYLVPAHAEHYPNDLKNTAARKIISDGLSSGRGNEHRIKEFRRVCERFHPVLRFFFMERFENPDDWFEKRLAYTRTTAAISMLGHILGLGDRHGHNILLDENTGEVVHIDLGIAFEQGRVLPVPELVPFRLTRDIVDGMGITKTEGVFRRCCEFTLDALRKESYSIMTILDVLRYDPLYNWSLSPLRLKRLQEEAAPDDEDPSAVNAFVKGEKKENEEAEADRALTVVAKKLSKSLSVEATVNELIQQASDEKNLALLFAGWAAYI